jgi:hypothetical protein
MVNFPAILRLATSSKKVARHEKFTYIVVCLGETTYRLPRLPRNIELVETLMIPIKWLDFWLFCNTFMLKLSPNKVEVAPNGLAGIPDGLARTELGNFRAEIV